MVIQNNHFGVLNKKYIMNNWCHRFLTLNSVDFPNYQQQGFQPNLRCLTTAFALQETALYHIERHCDVYVASLDQKAAFEN